MLEDRPRTLLAVLVERSNRTHEEHVTDFNRCATELGESATLSLRQFERWLAGGLKELPRKTARRVAEAHWRQPISELLGPPKESNFAADQKSTSANHQPIMGEIIDERDDMRRRAILRSAFAGTAAILTAPALNAIENIRRSMDSVLDSTNVSTSTIDRWERTAHEYASSYQTVPPQGLLADVVTDFAEMRSLLEQRQPIRLRRRLCRSNAQMAILAGIFFSAMGHQREARSWFHTAKLAADEADDAKLSGMAIVRSATVSFYYGSPATALEQAQTALYLLGQRPCASQVRARVVAARAMARLGGRKSEATSLIAEAEETFGRLSTGEINNTALGFTERQFWFTTGNAYTHLGMRSAANEAQLKALSLYQPTEYLDPALIYLDQARVFVNSHDAIAGCELASATIAAAPEQHRSGLIMHYGRQFYADLPSSARNLPEARRLVEALAE